MSVPSDRYTPKWLQNSLLGRLALVSADLKIWWEGSFLGKMQGSLEPWAHKSAFGFWLMPLALGWASILLFAIALPISNDQLGIFLLLGAVLWAGLFLTKKQPLSPLTLPVIAFWAAGVFSTAASIHSETSLRGLGLFTLYVIAFALLARLCQSPKYRTALLGCYLLAVLPVCLYGLYQQVTGVEPLAGWIDADSSLAGTTRIYSYIGSPPNPNLLAGYLIPAVPLGVAGAVMFKAWSAKAIAGVCAGLAALCMLLTYSRSGFLALGAIVFVLALFGVQTLSRRLPGPWRFWLWPAMIGVGVLALGLISIAAPAVVERFTSIFSSKGDSSSAHRVNVWVASFQMFQDNPWWGIGPGDRTFKVVYPFYQRGSFDALGAYSIPLEIAVEMGVLGLSAFLWILWTTGVWGVNSWRNLMDKKPQTALLVACCLTALAGLMVQGFVETVWYRPQVQTLWWFALAMLAGICVEEPLTLRSGDKVSELD
jgi:putative inorganic carbon (hco3(-)) transporter